MTDPVLCVMFCTSNVYAFTSHAQLENKYCLGKWQAGIGNANMHGTLVIGTLDNGIPDTA